MVANKDIEAYYIKNKQLIDIPIRAREENHDCWNITKYDGPH